MKGSRIVQWTYRAAVVGLGVGLGLLTLLYFVFATNGQESDILKVVIPFFLSLGVIALGVGLYRGEADGSRVLAVGASGLAGMVLLGIASSFTLAIQRLEGGGATEYRYLVLTNGSIGAAVGTLLGVYRVRLQRRTDQLASEVNHLNEFAGIVAHDLRNPLHIAQGYLGELDRSGSEGEIATIERSHARMERLIERVLDLSRRGDVIGERRRVSVESVARTAWSDTPTDGAELRVASDRTVDADERRLRSLFENLFRNAVEHGSTSRQPAADDAVEHGSTNLRSRAPEDAVEHGSTSNPPSSADDAVERGLATQQSGNAGTVECDVDAITVAVGAFEGGFYVADDGCGIPPKRRERIFEGGYSSAETGTGLGLAIVRQIANAHDWTIDVTESDAGGARFEFWL